MSCPRAEAAASAVTYRSFSLVFVFFNPLRSLQSQQPFKMLNKRGAKCVAAPLRYFKGEVHTEGGGGGGDGSFTGRLFLKGWGGGSLFH